MRYQPRTDDYNFQNASITELPKCRKSLRQKLKPCTKLGIGEKFSNTHTLVNTHIQQAHGTCRFKESRTSLGDGVDVKSEFKREIESDFNELLGLNNQVFNRGEKGSGESGIESSLLTTLSSRFLLDSK